MQTCWSALERTTVDFHGWAFNLENEDDEIAKSHIKKVWGPRDRKGWLGKFNFFFLSGSILQILFYFTFLIEKSRKKDHSRILPISIKPEGTTHRIRENCDEGEECPSTFPSPSPSALPWDSYQVPILAQANLRRGSFKYDLLKVQKDAPIMAGFQPWKTWRLF